MSGMTENDINMTVDMTAGKKGAEGAEPANIAETAESAGSDPAQPEMKEISVDDSTAMMEKDETVLSRQEAVAEALVFASGEPVKLESIAIVLNTDKREATKVMERLRKRYDDRKGGIILRKMDKSYQFSTVPELREELRPFVDRSSDRGLSRAAMETLSVICYNQPVTRAGIEYVRGVNSDGVLVRLIEKGLVEECGRSDAPGRPILYGTTVKFLQAMGIEKISDLPYVQKIVFNEQTAGSDAEPDNKPADDSGSSADAGIPANSDNGAITPDPDNGAITADPDNA